MEKIELLKMFLEGETSYLVLLITLAIIAVLNYLFLSFGLFKIAKENKKLCFIPVYNRLILAKTAKSLWEEREKEIKFLPMVVMITYIAVWILAIAFFVALLVALSSLLVSANNAIEAGEMLNVSHLSPFIAVIAFYFMAMAMGIIYCVLRAICCNKIFVAQNRKNTKVLTVLSAVVPLFASVSIFLSKKQ